jgi:hypothetical protein
MPRKRATKSRAAARAVRTRRVYLGKGLSRAEAWKKARAKPGPDFRGFDYSSATGWATLV